jgi:hypothetical protein
VDQIVWAQDITATGLGDGSGLAVRKGNEVVIGVNKDDVSTRLRFTIAHEQAHAPVAPWRESAPR